ncbi:PREDICTED: uncharacterized protein LOC109129609 [Camelina sativa]|uniref:Uncharacterized protein LOC109129609 n=1 Tax=Camelina sativa TaxID=90675 RepID=A0ABM1R3M3_CAMSA|nr:PREDICTED: uncharacterized protein LOC109129609 [Camelina sativa]
MQNLLYRRGLIDLVRALLLNSGIFFGFCDFVVVVCFATCILIPFASASSSSFVYWQFICGAPPLIFPGGVGKNNSTPWILEPIEVRDVVAVCRWLCENVGAHRILLVGSSAVVLVGNTK